MTTVPKAKIEIVVLRIERELAKVRQELQRPAPRSLVLDKIGSRVVKLSDQLRPGATWE
jgi:hypothetical protein